MNAKEKAEELIERFYKASGVKKFSMIYAIMTVDEIINLLQSFNDLESVIVVGELSTSVLDHIVLWSKVKEEILLINNE